MTRLCLAFLLLQWPGIKLFGSDLALVSPNDQTNNWSLGHASVVDSEQLTLRACTHEVAGRHLMNVSIEKSGQVTATPT